MADDGTGSVDETSHENPGAVIVTLLDQEKVDWAILTNGRIWRLYSAKTHSSATNYYEIDLEETLAIPRERAKEAKDALLYFWLLFRADAFIAQGAIRLSGASLPSSTICCVRVKPMPLLWAIHSRRRFLRYLYPFC